jgi:hypothetical protein
LRGARGGSHNRQIEPGLPLAVASARLGNRVPLTFEPRVRSIAYGGAFSRPATLPDSPAEAGEDQGLVEGQFPGGQGRI